MLAGQPRLARADDVRPGRRRDAAAGQGLPAGRLVPRDDRVGAAARVAARRIDAASRRLGRDAGRRRDRAVLPRRAGTGATSRRSIAESDEMYARMLGVSRPAGRGSRRTATADPDYLEVARQELYRGQCNCPYWHGSFGGLYLPHLRNAIYRSLIAADNALDDAEGRTGPARRARGRRLQPRRPPGSPPRERPADRAGAAGAGRAHLRARRPAAARRTCWPRSTAAPRPTTRRSARPRRDRPTARSRRAAAEPDASEPIVLKQQGLDRLLVYDRHPRKALVDHFYPRRRDPRRPDRLPRGRARRFRRRDLSGASPARGATGRGGHGAAGPCRRPFDPAPQDDRAGGRQPGAWPSTTSSKTCPRERVPPLRRRDQPGGHGRPCARPLLLRPGRHQARDARRPARPAPHLAA